MPNLHPGHPVGVSTNIYDGLVTRNVVDRTFSVDEVGASYSTHPGARIVPGLTERGGSVDVLPPPPRGMLDRGSVEGMPTFLYPNLAPGPKAGALVGPTFRGPPRGT